MRPDQETVECWVASAWLLAEQRFRKIDGHRDLWALAAILGRRLQVQQSQEQDRISEIFHINLATVLAYLSLQICHSQRRAQFLRLR